MYLPYATLCSFDGRIDSCSRSNGPSSYKVTPCRRPSSGLCDSVDDKTTISFQYKPRRRPARRTTITIAQNLRDPTGSTVQVENDNQMYDDVGGLPQPGQCPVCGLIRQAAEPQLCSGCSPTRHSAGSFRSGGPSGTRRSYFALGARAQCDMPADRWAVGRDTIATAPSTSPVIRSKGEITYFNTVNRAGITSRWLSDQGGTRT